MPTTLIIIALILSILIFIRSKWLYNEIRKSSNKLFEFEEDRKVAFKLLIWKIWIWNKEKLNYIYGDHWVTKNLGKMPD
ncbi:MAG: hypothetical protein PHT40_00145 [Patescibacteria group bacterium]|nr:hypothetical protein [Patescibacteria group bacterium]